MKNITKILTALLVLATASLHGQSNVTVSYGSASSGPDGSIFGNAAGNGFDNAVKGLIAFGWSDGFDDTTTTKPKQKQTTKKNKSTHQYHNKYPEHTKI
jgi:hypothetical protein